FRLGISVSGQASRDGSHNSPPHKTHRAFTPSSACLRRIYPPPIFFSCFSFLLLLVFPYLALAFGNVMVRIRPTIQFRMSQPSPPQRFAHFLSSNQKFVFFIFCCLLFDNYQL